MIATTPELMPEPQDFPPVASTSLLELTNTAEGALLITNLVIDPTVTVTTISMNIRIFEQFIQEYDQQALHNQEYDQRLTLTQSELDLNKNYCKVMEAVECIQYIQDRMVMTNVTHLHQQLCLFLFVVLRLRASHVFFLSISPIFLVTPLCLSFDAISHHSYAFLLFYCLSFL